MKLKLIAGALLLALSPMADAATYVLDNVSYVNFFFSPPREIGGPQFDGECTSCGVSEAIVDGNDVTLTTITWSANASGENYTISFSGTTELGLGVSLTKDPGHSCVGISGSTCDPANIKSGMNVDAFYTGLASDGVTACANCYVNVTEGAGTLLVEIRRQLLEEQGGFPPPIGNHQTFFLNYTIVPVPAAAWLFGSALGLLAVGRRRRAAAA